MFHRFSIRLRDDAHHRVQWALRIKGIVNIIRLSEEIRLSNLTENIAREDIEDLVMQVAQLYGAPIEFDDDARTAIDLPSDFGQDNRNDLEKMLDGRTCGGDITSDLLQLRRD
ncbi:hypothetical protein LB553_20465 [Mesorhizobium sp. CA8]|uniref:hypothetical protein n=1 Tax=unclassified Mesorhizobium TaxID=325217 RepID=UPI001CC93550|nr:MULTISPECIES: hypothetical protein [unclassified Mesorhizobium]MBZ9763237.1 hypothetical protein [Mesorhizobium sp. CA8]MBZ9819131.1 hypothetical protein [Mesorhizobium sp. CA4]